MTKLAGPLHRLAKAAGGVCDALSGAILAALVAIVLWGVFTRFALGAASWWTEEAARLLLIWLTMIGAAAASARAEHLGVDYFVGKMHPDARRMTHFTAELAVVAFVAAALVYGGLILAIATFRSGQTTPAMGIPMGLVYLAAPIGGAAMILFSLDRIASLGRKETETSSIDAGS